MQKVDCVIQSLSDNRNCWVYSQHTFRLIDDTLKFTNHTDWMTKLFLLFIELKDYNYDQFYNYTMNKQLDHRYICINL